MAIVNRTPDSFYDKGRTFGLDEAVAAAHAAIADGADWVDIGGVPFARGTQITAADEIDRVVPVIEALSGQAGTVISVDTFRPEVARRSITAGAHVINDTSGLRDAAMAKIVAGSDASLVITHSFTPPRGKRPSYTDVVVEVVDFLRDRVTFAIDCGVPAERSVRRQRVEQCFEPREISRGQDDTRGVTFHGNSQKKVRNVPRQRELTSRGQARSMCLFEPVRYIRCANCRPC